jgi:hypothetical protein
MIENGGSDIMDKRAIDGKVNVVLIIFMTICLLFVDGTAMAGKGSSKDTGTDVGGSAQCSDGLDNDGDNRCDYGGCNVGKGKDKVALLPDPDCSSPSDNSEAPSCVPQTEICDGRDNDCDTQIDEGCPPPCPVITSYMPLELCGRTDNNIEVNGYNFMIDSVVILRPGSHLRTRFLSDKKLNAIVPAGTPAGIYEIEVNNLSNGCSNRLGKLQVFDSVFSKVCMTP